MHKADEDTIDISNNGFYNTDIKSLHLTKQETRVEHEVPREIKSICTVSNVPSALYCNLKRGIW